MSVHARLALMSMAFIAAPFLPAAAETPAGNDVGTFKRQSQASAEELQRQLADVPVIGLGNSAGAVMAAYADRIQKDLAQQQMPVAVLDALPLLELRPDLRTLPLRRGDGSKLSAASAATLETLSRKLRAYLDQGAPIDSQGQRPLLPRLREVLQAELRGKKPEWLRPEAIPTLLQLLTHEDKPVRLMLVDLLQAIPGKASSAALARRAAFDLDPDVRQAAVVALRDRPLTDSRRELVSLLRYPWAPAAEHAAEALVNLQDHGVIGQLVATLDAPDPLEPIVDGQGGSAVRQLVRIHHLTNCLLCHPPASTAQNPVLGGDPVLPLPPTSSGLKAAALGLRSTAGAHIYGSGSSSGVTPALLRADVTYLRQDFSVLQALPPQLAGLRAASGPLAAQTQRFDFVLQKRPLSKQQTAELRKLASERVDYPQRQAVLFALRELTGKDAGNRYADWLKLYPDAGEEAEAARLASDLSEARGNRRDQLLSRYRDEKGVVFTLALAGTIHAFEGEFQGRARSALAERLTRMTSATLRERLREEDPELRRAAVVASGRKGDAELVPDVIALLDDKDSDVAESAESTLRELTGKSFTSSAELRAWFRSQSADRRVK
jgi:hypothetical protein